MGPWAMFLRDSSPPVPGMSNLSFIGRLATVAFRVGTEPGSSPGVTCDLCPASKKY